MKTALLLSAALGAASALTASALPLPTPALDLKAADYNASTGVWTDSSGNGDNAIQSIAANQPLLIPGATPNGSSAVGFNGSSDFLTLTTPIGSAAYTVLTFLDATGGGNAQTIISSGANGHGFQYRVGGDTFTSQEDLRQGQANLGHGTTSLSGAGFVNINTVIDGSGGTFRFNGAADGTATGSTFADPLNMVGSANGGEWFQGGIAEIQVFTSVLSPSQIASIENQFNSAYVSAVPEPSTWIAAGGLLLLAAGDIRRRWNA